MFNFVHEQKWIVYTILTLIILSFALWGVSSYDMSGNSAGVVATVDDAKITQQEFDNVLRQQQDRLRQQLGANFDATMFDNPEMKRALIDSLISQRLLVDRAKASRLVVTDHQMAQVISGIEAFQEGGKFDRKRYASVLADNNMSPAVYETRLRNELLGQQIQETYEHNGHAANSVVENIVRLTEQQWMVSVSPVSLEKFMAQAKVDDAALKNYYDLNQSEFQVPEQLKVEYVRLAEEDLQGKVQVHAEEVRKYYDEHQNEFGTSEERQAAHILINAAPAATQAERDAAKAKAEQLLQQARKNSGKFAELAEQNSQDPGSAAKGGDLGFFGRGMMVKPFEEAAFGLKVGEISGLVQSDFGFHIIKLMAIKPSRTLPFEEARADITNKLRQQKAADMFAELAEKFSNTVYEQSDTLKPAAALAGAKLEQSAWLTKGRAAGDPWTGKMLQAIFSDEVIKNKRNTAAIEVAPNTLVTARVLEHKPASLRTLSEVQEIIRQKLLRQQAVELAEKQGNALMEQLQRGEQPKLAWGAAQSITRVNPGALDAGLAKQIFRVNTAKLPQYVGAQDAQQGYLLVRIDAVKQGEAINDAKRAGYAQKLRQLTGEEMLQAYLADAKQRAKITVNLPDQASGNAPE